MMVRYSVVLRSHIPAGNDSFLNVIIYLLSNPISGLLCNVLEHFCLSIYSSKQQIFPNFHKI